MHQSSMGGGCSIHTQGQRGTKSKMQAGAFGHQAGTEGEDGAGPKVRGRTAGITIAEKELEAKRQLLKHWQRIAGEVKDMEEEDDGDVPRVQLQP